MEASLSNIRKDVQMQKKSDRQMSTAWLLVYIIPLIISVVASCYFVTVFMDLFSTVDFSLPSSSYSSYDWLPDEFMSVWIIVMLTGAANSVATLTLNYLLVNRRATHFKRQNFLHEDTISTIGSIAKTKEIDMDADLSSLQRTLKEANIEKTEKSAILWSILSMFVPFVQLYVYYFLVNDFYRHERIEDSFWADVSTAMNKLDINFSMPRRTEAMPYRSFVLYLILSIVTMGLFVVYWLYALLKDPNTHFKYHTQTENQLLTVLESATTQETPC
ncbi:MAG: hypothetical protein CW691_10660 [Candidatus Bathyarchaeum sp.]|nr:MAG: hypothetical protein CW691_10660 [Candidatus Bathyarchaeum sp.]